jgi:KIF-binding protein
MTPRVFLSAQTWPNKAKEYYTSENEASEYAIIVQDLAALFKYLAFFDDDDNQC